MKFIVRYKIESTTNSNVSSREAIDLFCTRNKSSTGTNVDEMDPAVRQRHSPTKSKDRKQHTFAVDRLFVLMKGKSLVRVARH